jgi:hypothetical protein
VTQKQVREFMGDHAANLVIPFTNQFGREVHDSFESPSSDFAPTFQIFAPVQLGN